MILKLKNDAFSLFILLIPRSLFFQISTSTPFMLPDCSKLAINRKKWRHNCWYNVFVNFLDVVVFLILSLLTCLSFMSISLLVMELWQFSFIRIDQKYGKLKYPVWFLAEIWKLGRVWDAKIGRNILGLKRKSYIMLLLDFNILKSNEPLSTAVAFMYTVCNKKIYTSCIFRIFEICFIIN